MRLPGLRHDVRRACRLAQKEGPMASDVAQVASRVFRSPGLKFLAIAALTVAMAIPLFFINMALSDREESANSAVVDIANGWGNAQTLGGPVLLVPYEMQ